MSALSSRGLPILPGGDRFKAMLSLMKHPGMPTLSRLSLGHFLTDNYASFMLPILPFLAASLHFDLAAAGLLSLISSVTASILQPAFGWLGDRYPRLNGVSLGVALSALFIGLLGWCPDFWTLCLAVAIGYAGVGLFHPMATSCTHRLKATRKNLVMSIFISAGTSGYAVGPLLSALLVQTGGLHATAWAILPGLLTLPFLRNLNGETHPPITVHPLGSAPLPKHREEPIDAGHFTPPEIKAISLLTIINIFRAIVLVALPTFMPFQWKAEGYDAMTMGWVLGLATFIGGPASLMTGWLGDRINERKVLLYSFLPAFLLLPLLVFTEGLASFTGFILVTGTLTSTMGINLVVALRVAKKKPNIVSGIVGGLSFGIAGLLMPPLGWIAQRFSIGAAMAVLYLPLILGLIAISRIPTEWLTRRTPAESVPLPLEQAETRWEPLQQTAV